MHHGIEQKRNHYKKFIIKPLLEKPVLYQDPSFLDRNNSRETPKIDYEKFGAKRGYHRARHNLKVAHDFLPLFYRNLKTEFNTTIEGAIAATAASSEAQSFAESAKDDARMYARQAGEAQAAAKDAQFDALDARREAEEAIGRTRQEREQQEQQTLRLAQMQTETHLKNVELTEENNQLKKQLAAMEQQQLVLAEENAKQIEQNEKYAAENQRIRLQAQRSRHPSLGILDLSSGSPGTAASTTSQKTNAPSPRSRLKRWTRAFKKEGGRKRTKKKCSKRRLKKKCYV